MRVTATLHKAQMVNVSQDVASEIATIASHLNANRKSIKSIQVSMIPGTGDVALLTIEVPASTDGTPDGATWEALMSPTGDTTLEW